MALAGVLAVSVAPHAPTAVAADLPDASVAPAATGATGLGADCDEAARMMPGDAGVTATSGRRAHPSGPGAAGAPLSARMEEDTFGGVEPAERSAPTTSTPSGTAAKSTATTTARAAAGSVTIYVTFHVITGGGVPNVPRAQLDKQIAVMNQAFAGKQVAGGGAATPFKFRIDSITRPQKAAWTNLVKGSSQDRAMTSALRAGTKKRLNVYITTLSGNTLGWSTFPWAYAGNPKRDGIVLAAGTLPGGSLSGYNLGDTLVHEAGHWLGLYHTFEKGCTAPGDSVADTPAEASPAYGCPTGRNTCPASGSDPITNFMDYSTDSCMHRFSAGQADRMDAQWKRYRT